MTIRTYIKERVMNEYVGYEYSFIWDMTETKEEALFHMIEDEKEIETIMSRIMSGETVVIDGEYSHSYRLVSREEFEEEKANEIELDEILNIIDFEDMKNNANSRRNKYEHHMQHEYCA